MSELKSWKVKVLQDGDGTMNGSFSPTYKVKASTAKDAIQLAFALDGGWGSQKNALGLLPLAQEYASAVEIPRRRNRKREKKI